MKRRIFIASLVAVFLPKEAAAIPSTGIASWYGGRWHGRKTASGAKFNKNSLTCAMNNVPFGSRLRVTDTATGKNVVVFVNDRIGYPDRLLDLSEGAAKRLGIINKGLAWVRLKRLAIILP